MVCSPTTLSPSLMPSFFIAAAYLATFLLNWANVHFLISVLPSAMNKIN